VELPAGFSFMGGTVTLKAVVVAPAGVSNVKAFVNGPAGASEITLGFLAGGYYSAGYTAPANTSKDGIDANYSVVFTATDTEGRKVSSAPVVFVVPAPPSPPPPPG